MLVIKFDANHSPAPAIRRGCFHIRPSREAVYITLRHARTQGDGHDGVHDRHLPCRGRLLGNFVLHYEQGREHAARVRQDEPRPGAARPLRGRAGGGLYLRLQERLGGEHGVDCPERLPGPGPARRRRGALQGGDNGEQGDRRRDMPRRALVHKPLRRALCALPKIRPRAKAACGEGAEGLLCMGTSF